MWRKWSAPWRQIERLVRQIGQREQPRTFLVDGSKEAQRVALALDRVGDHATNIGEDAVYAAAA